MTVYALLVGIDDYARWPLRGCVADIDRVQKFLAARVSDGPVELVLRNRDATRHALIEGIRSHLGQARKDDVALFWFCGHGSQEPVPEQYWHAEPNGYLQTLVCSDSRDVGADGRRIPDLLDKELELLLDEVAARGPHVIVVLDSCHSGGATRDPDVAVRGLDRIPDGLPLSSFLPELSHPVLGSTLGGPDGAPSHVLLAACRLDERAHEIPIDGIIHGAFSHALLGALQTLDPAATYRDLLSTARATVANLAPGQSPTLEPAEMGLADQPFLGGRITRPSAFRLHRGPPGWEVDAGRCHGVPEPAPDDPMLFAVPSAADSATGVRLLRVVEVRATTSLVAPEGWVPDAGRTYPVVVASVPMPQCAVVVGGLTGDDAAAADLVRVAIGHAGPDGGPSPDVRVVGAADQVQGLRLRVATTESGDSKAFQILRGDETRATADIAGFTERSAKLVVARLEHIARWTHLQQLENPASGLTGAVRVEVVTAEDGQEIDPGTGPLLLPDSRGEIRVSYTWKDGRWTPPRVFVRLRNTSPHPLWCVLLDLNDRYGSDASLFCGQVGPGHVGAVKRGRPLSAMLPPGRKLVPGAEVRDWLKLIVAEEPIGQLSFELPPLDQPRARTRSLGIAGFVERLGLRATTRNLSEVPVSAVEGDWTTAVLPLVSQVP